MEEGIEGKGSVGGGSGGLAEEDMVKEVRSVSSQLANGSGMGID
jgi:hypothetical protein